MSGKGFYVGYWDLLGQKDAMKDLWEPSSTISQEAQEKVNITTSAILSALASIRQLYAKDDDMGELLEVLRKNEPQVWKSTTKAQLEKEFKALKCGVCQFSDSTLFYIEGGKRLTIPLLQYTCIVIGKLLPRLHACGLFPRGAIAFGDANVVKRGNIVGPVVDLVSKVENKSSFYARIVVESDTREKINKSRSNIDNAEYSPKYANMLLSLIQQEPDLYWSINPLAKIVADDNRSGVEERDYFYCIENAFAILRQEHSELKKRQMGYLKNGELKKIIETSRVIDKVFYLSEFYRQRFDQMDQKDIKNRIGSTFADIGRSATVPIGDYYVLYIKLEPMDGEKYSPQALEAYLAFVKILRDNLRNAPRLFYKGVLKNLGDVLDENRFYKEILNTNIGVQQIATHLMIYVKNTNSTSALIFMHILRAMSIGLVNAVCAKQTFSAAVCINRGWEIEQDCLQGPVINEAYQLATRTDRIGRIAISFRFVKFINQDKNVLIQWPEIKDNGFIVDTDGILTWNYALKELDRDYKVINNGSFSELCLQAKNNLCAHVEKIINPREKTRDQAARWRAFKFWEGSFETMLNHGK